MSLNFEDYQKEANTWLHVVANHLGISDRDQAGRIFKSVLHAIRDRIPTGDALHFGAQLPLIWKGVYYDGFHMHEPLKIRHEDEWLEFIRSKDSFAQGYDFPTNDHVRVAFQDVMRALSELVSPGQYYKLMNSLHSEIRDLVEEEMVSEEEE
ncbi:MAG: DUF2267 domain-containing protein [Hymenobacteraceae bacterium]|nr:DUF2267 domain-containing protein [Hymenobacteraceae bacterium]MDX5395693.1 DUF2267 domain-containing protein [Hymenobacteraceae bacterium]MDX5442406.1 DUF2267 domain-containing protein [Hymenobacteraceae bacterium]MDX5511747.1 DUF2267 domain-containing protein [Hymenobacteraceae bacterium]